LFYCRTSTRLHLNHRARLNTTSSSPIARRHTTMLLRLPRELRFRIYSYVGTPLVSRPSTFAGLYLSCEAVREDLDADLPRSAKLLLDDPPSLNHRWPLLKLIEHSIPTSFADLPRTHITVGLPSWILPQSRLAEQRAALEQLVELMSYHIHTVTVQIFDELGNEEHIHWPDIEHLAARFRCLLCPQLCIWPQHIVDMAICYKHLPYLPHSPYLHKPRLQKLILTIKSVRKDLDVQAHTYARYPRGEPFGYAYTLHCQKMTNWDFDEENEDEVDWLTHHPTRFVWKRTDGLKPWRDFEMVKIDGQYTSLTPVRKYPLWSSDLTQLYR
jgi:hypothetical protein